MSEKEREGAGSFGAGEAKGDNDGGGDTAVGYKLPAMLAGRYRRYEERGAQGLTHGLRGGGGNRLMAAEVRERIAELYRGRYEGFGPVLFGEKLEATHEISVDHETVRRLLIKEGLWRVTRKRKKRHKAWRARRGHFGELVQMDGSHHLWFEIRGKMYCLMVMIDDATGIRMSLLSE